ncbi:MAG TPA: hypothetical protein VE631_03835, partial [Alphaproteobacteria bacterium]|nr:hypothetical protein [Alphaproteobacteria bacterium]
MQHKNIPTIFNHSNSRLGREPDTGTLRRLSTAVLSRMPAPLRDAPWQLALRQVCRRHPGLFDRMAAPPGVCLAIEPVDLPVVFVLWPDPQRPRLSLRGDCPAEAGARISGRFLDLVDLLEGSRDG